MDDIKIVDLYWERSESAITETAAKYGKMLKGISVSLVGNGEDADECVNDTYHAAWNSMPTDRPAYLGAYLAKIIRRISIDRFRYTHRQKRPGTYQILDELSECLPHTESIDSLMDQKRLTDVINLFLASLDTEKRVIFVRRYFYSEAISDIAHNLGMSEGKIKTVLYRLRDSLRKILEKEELL